MDLELKQALMRCETDVEGALYRFSENEDLYISCLKSFLSDQTLNELDSAIKEEKWDAAFTAAHALKGLAGNMGFVPLFHAAAEMVVIIRAGRTRDIPASYQDLKQCYAAIAAAIRQNFPPQIN